MAVRQTVVSSTNSPKTLTFNKLSGVDYSSSPFEVNTSRATSMKNMINEDGVNHKRHGWSEDLEINKTINEKNITNIKGIYIPNNKSDKLKYIIATDSKIYSFMNVGGYYTFDVNKNDSEYIVNFVANKNKIIMFYPSAIYAFDLDSSKYEDYTKGDSYVPTTTISINPISSEDSTRKSFEYANLLNARRKNTLIGAKESEFNILYFTVDYSAVGSDFSNIKNQSIYISDVGENINQQFTPTTEIKLSDGISSFPLRSTDEKITMVIKFKYNSIFPSTTYRVCCKVFDTNKNLLYKAYESVLGDFFTVDISEMKSLRIVYEKELI